MLLVDIYYLIIFSNMVMSVRTITKLIFTAFTRKVSLVVYKHTLCVLSKLARISFVQNTLNLVLDANGQRSV